MNIQAHLWCPNTLSGRQLMGFGTPAFINSHVRFMSPVRSEFSRWRAEILHLFIYTRLHTKHKTVKYGSLRVGLHQCCNYTGLEIQICHRLGYIVMLQLCWMAHCRRWGSFNLVWLSLVLVTLCWVTDPSDITEFTRTLTVPIKICVLSGLWPALGDLECVCLTAT